MLPLIVVYFILKKKEKKKDNVEKRKKQTIYIILVCFLQIYVGYLRLSSKCSSSTDFNSGYINDLILFCLWICSFCLWKSLSRGLTGGEGKPPAAWGRSGPCIYTLLGFPKVANLWPSLHCPDDVTEFSPHNVEKEFSRVTFNSNSLTTTTEF